jgi:sulfite reductase beta subunit-like hemoprotein
VALPNIPAAKRAGLPVDLERLRREGDDWLSPEERYALKTHGICTQLQTGMFMVRARIPGGALDTDAARGLADLAQAHGRGWLHLTTRQQVELHHVPAREAPDVIEGIAALGLTTRAACGHTVRGVMACPDAGVGLEEPFDVHPDARAVSEWLVERSAVLNVTLPSRINISFGGCRGCRDHAKTNEIGFVATIVGGVLGYELWLGGSLGKSVPTLGVQAVPFLPRTEVLAAVDAVVDVFVTHGNFEQPAKARLKFLVRDLGLDPFLSLFRDAFEKARAAAYPPPAAVSTPLSAPLHEILGHAPEGGWGSGIRPQRLPGRAMVTVNVPLGDVDAEDLRLLADLADAVADERLYLTRNQNVMLRHVPVTAVSSVRARLAAVGLGLEGADQAVDVRACTGGPVCALAITAAQSAGAALLDLPGLRRNSDVRVHVSGCPNACAQHQIADLGFSGGKVTINGASTLGYQVWLGGDLAADVVGAVVGRIAEEDVPAITEAVVGVWEALRMRGESLAATVARCGLDAFRAHVEHVFTGRWEPGPEPEPEGLPVVVMGAAR